MPLKTLIDYVEGGYPLAEFLENFPTASRSMAIEALAEAKNSLRARIACMKVLRDECLSERFRRQIRAMMSILARYAGFSGKRNGELLQLSEAAGCDVLIAVDQGIRFQQRMSGRGIALIVLRVPGNDIGTLARLAKTVLEVLRDITPGAVVELVLPAGSEA